MFCQNCGSGIEIQETTCSQCGSPNFLYSPLNGGETIRVVAYFLILVGSSIFIVGLIPLIITLCSIYILKKDKKFSSILISEKLINSYIIIISIGLMGNSVYNSIPYYIDYGEFGTWHPYVYEPFFGSFLVLIIIPLLKYLYFSILKKHKEWIIDNGIFSDGLNKKKSSFIENIAKKSQPCSMTDEILKWSELLEKNLITKEEFDCAKQKILNKGNS